MHNSHQLTRDGSSTLFNDHFGETYHSRHGAIQESQHVFMDMAWNVLNPKPEILRIFEMGFGTGLNTLLAGLRANADQQQLSYTSLEAYPISKPAQASLNYGEVLNGQALFNSIHEAAWNEEIQINDYFHLHKIETSLQDHDFGDNIFDIVFYDAFAPNSQPELWTEPIFEKLYAHMREGSILTTYCAKGDVRRAMKAVGFKTERAQGPPGKREMLRATKL
ncbi:MAG: tRNA (5-methylaminomethyl-2-thiouridine)(34)-methyltransferase MnmD [Bacteroidia bacterium]